MPEDFRKDATEHMYLEDIKTRDIDNLQLVHDHEIKEYWFDKESQAMRFMGDMTNKILSRLGVDQLGIVKKNVNRASRKFIEKLIDKEMKRHDVRVERRKYTGDDWWRTGIYFYHHNEIAYFISEPIKTRGGKSKDSRLIIPSRIRYLVRTNYKN